MDIVTNIEKLRVRCESIKGSECSEHFNEISGYLRNNLGAVGLALPQIGINKRGFAVQFNGLVYPIINPKILKKSNDKKIGPEGCLSIPGKTFAVKRSDIIVVSFIMPDGKIMAKEFFGWVARVFQHEYDHLNGVLISDIGTEVIKEAGA